VLVDISIDRGCFQDPGRQPADLTLWWTVLHYGVANMPGAVPHTSTYALTNVTLPYAIEIANRGWRQALRADKYFAPGLNTHDGVITLEPVAQAHGLPWTPLTEVLASMGVQLAERGTVTTGANG
jgi:alanine dehydrogenase